MISISGGEPLEHPDISRILGACSGTRVILFSNLHDISESFINDLFSFYGIAEIIVSIDGLLTHRKTRPPSNASDIMDQILRVKSVSPETRITVNTILTKHNLVDLIDLQKELVGLGVNHWRIDLPMKSLSATVYASFYDMVSSVADVIKKRYEDADLQKMEISAFRVYKSSLEGVVLDDVANIICDDAHPCEYAIGRMAVSVDGNVSICSPLHYSMVNAWEASSFSDLAERLAKHPFFQMSLNDIKGCSGCRYYRLCGTGCRGEALEWLGNHDNVDPLSCSLMQHIESIIVPILSPQLQQLYRELIDIHGRNPTLIFPSQREMSEFLTKNDGGVTC